MSDLISRRKIRDYIQTQINPYGKPFEGTPYELGLKIMKHIDAMDSAYNVDKVVEELEEKTTLAYNRYMDCPSYNPTLALHSPVFERYKTQYQERKMCLEIVRRGGVE